MSVGRSFFTVRYVMRSLNVFFYEKSVVSLDVATTLLEFSRAFLRKYATDIGIG